MASLSQPGERFSVNDFVGERTREKGFVSAGTIQQGHFKDDVGGGISQFATTLFNAAFFAGLEFDDYQSHTIYISRYPYGREATLNYPDVDLAFINNTPYGILIWPEYTEHFDNRADVLDEVLGGRGDRPEQLALRGLPLGRNIPLPH